MYFEAAAFALRKGDREKLIAAMESAFEGLPQAESIAPWVDFVLDPDAPAPEVDAQDRPFMESVVRLCTEGEEIEHPSRLEIGRNLDFLAECGVVEDWTPVQYLNYLLMRRIEPRGKAAVVGTMRDDGIYTIEWVAHYLALGFEHLFIYTNDNADGSEVLLRRLADHGIVTLIESRTAGKVPPERKAFEHSVHLLRQARDYEWLLYVDSDEFLILAPPFENAIGNMLTAMVARHPERVPSAILFDWLWYVSGAVYERRPGMMLERFQHARPHFLTKVLVRLSDVVSMRAQHHPELKPNRMTVDSAFRPVNLNTIWERRTPRYDGGWLCHFWPKSFEEFSLKKARGDSLKLEDNEYSRAFGLFFAWNGAETDDNHYPPDPALVAAVNEKAAALRALDGVVEAEGAVNARFADLVARYDRDGGLRAIYDASRREPEPF